MEDADEEVVKEKEVAETQQQEGDEEEVVVEKEVAETKQQEDDEEEEQEPQLQMLPPPKKGRGKQETVAPEEPMVIVGPQYAQPDQHKESCKPSTKVSPKRSRTAKPPEGDINGDEIAVSSKSNGPRRKIQSLSNN